MAELIEVHGAESIRQLILDVVRSLVDLPNDVTVSSLPERESVRFEVHVAESDLGKVIGKQGRTARSIRTILAAASMKNGLRMSVDFVA